MTRSVTILTGEPTVHLIGEMNIVVDGLDGLAAWVRSRRPECLPDDYRHPFDLFPHRCEHSGNELLVEAAGRACYSSFGLKAGRKTNAEYVEHMLTGDTPHRSVTYHAKMTFFFAGISRRFTHELIRNYVGSDRDEEGSPSQESTRFTHHHGFFVCPPRRCESAVGEVVDDTWLAESGEKVAAFERTMQAAYDGYVAYVETEVASFTVKRGHEPKGMDRKRIYEDASALLPHAAETSLVWTTNPAAIAKLVREREDEAADLEARRFAKKLREVAVAAAPNLFPQPWMKR